MRVITLALYSSVIATLLMLLANVWIVDVKAAQFQLRRNSCPAPYHVQTPDGRCVWSCSKGTQPNNATNECVCRDGYYVTGKDSFGRRICGKVSGIGNQAFRPTYQCTFQAVQSGGFDGRLSGTNQVEFSVNMSITNNNKTTVFIRPYAWTTVRVKTPDKPLKTSYHNCSFRNRWFGLERGNSKNVSGLCGKWAAGSNTLIGGKARIHVYTEQVAAQKEHALYDEVNCAQQVYKPVPK